MKKILVLLLMLFFANVAFAVTSYDRFERKVGSFKKDSSGRITEYDKYCRKVGSYK